MRLSAFSFFIIAKLYTSAVLCHHEVMWTRRRFLKSLAGFLLAAALPPVFRSKNDSSFVSPAFAASENTMLTRIIPVSGELLPAIGLGTWQTFDVSPSADRTPLRKVLKLFFEMGGTLIDSSPMYGRSETVTGELTAQLGVRDKTFFATKVWTSGKQAGIEQMNDSFRKFGVERMDLMQIHNLVDWQTHMETLRRWKEQGKIRYLGVTHYVPSAFDELETIMRAEKPDFVQLPYSIKVRGAEERLLPLAQDLGIAVIVNRPFEQGSLFRKVKGKPLPEGASELGCQTWAQFFLKFIVSHPAVTCVIPATSDPKHLTDNMQAGYGPQPSSSQREAMVRSFAQL